PLSDVAEGREPPKVFSAGYRRGQSPGDASKAREVVRHRHILEPAEAETLEPPADVHRLLGPPALVDVDHQRDVGTNALANDPGALDLALGRGLARQRQLHFHF